MVSHSGQALLDHWFNPDSIFFFFFGMSSSCENSAPTMHGGVRWKSFVFEIRLKYRQVLLSHLLSVQPGQVTGVFGRL